MELGTFGAVMGFAAQLVVQSADFYATASAATKNATLESLLQSLAQDARKDVATMEQTRRENVTEMILEPIAGLVREDYAIGLQPPGADAEIVQTGLRLEERDQKFFRDASARVPLPEVARVFRKTAQRKEQNISRLRALAAAVG
jgi:rubrerythrin